MRGWCMNGRVCETNWFVTWANCSRCQTIREGDCSQDAPSEAALGWEEGGRWGGREKSEAAESDGYEGTASKGPTVRGSHQEVWSPYRISLRDVVEAVRSSAHPSSSSWRNTLPGLPRCPPATVRCSPSPKWKVGRVLSYSERVRTQGLPFISLSLKKLLLKGGYGVKKGSSLKKKKNRDIILRTWYNARKLTLNCEALFEHLDIWTILKMIISDF